MVGFSKKDNIYRITRMTGNRDNILGISFATNESTKNNIEDLLCTIGRWIMFDLSDYYSEVN